MTGALHVTDETHLPTPRDKQLAVIRIGKMSHSVPANPVKERASRICWEKFPRMDGRS